MIRSFGYAWNGLTSAARSEQNFRIHLAGAFLTLLLAALLRVSHYEFLMIIVCIAAVMGTELLNTAIEKLCDFVSPEKKEAIRVIKDLSAAGVLIVAIGAAIAGLFIFTPKIYALLNG